MFRILLIFVFTVFVVVISNAQSLNCLDTVNNGSLQLSKSKNQKKPLDPIVAGQNNLKQKTREFLKKSGAYCKKNKLYDKSGKPITFYPDMSCRGRPYSPEEQKKEDEKMAKLREKYAIVFVGCYPPRE
jgi:hypothetical protein